MVLPYSTSFAVPIICYAIDAFVLFGRGLTFYQLVPSSAQWADFLTLALFMPVIKSATFETSHGY
jgi:hypothetical protein